MSKTFTYTRVIKSYYDRDLDETAEDTENFQYEVEDQEIEDAIVDITFHNYFKKIPMVTDKREHISACKKAIAEFISEYDLYDILKKNEGMEEDLKDYFENDAFESLED